MFQRAVPVTPHDTNASHVGGVCQGLYATGAGDVAIVLADDAVAQVIVVAMAAKSILKDVRVKTVLATGTTATGIKALFTN